MPIARLRSKSQFCEHHPFSPLPTHVLNSVAAGLQSVPNHHHVRRVHPAGKVPGFKPATVTGGNGNLPQTLKALEAPPLCKVAITIGIKYEHVHQRSILKCKRVDCQAYSDSPVCVVGGSGLPGHSCPAGGLPPSTCSSLRLTLWSRICDNGVSHWIVFLKKSRWNFALNGSIPQAFMNLEAASTLIPSHDMHWLIRMTVLRERPDSFAMAMRVMDFPHFLASILQITGGNLDNLSDRVFIN